MMDFLSLMLGAPSLLSHQVFIENHECLSFLQNRGRGLEAALKGLTQEVAGLREDCKGFEEGAQTIVAELKPFPANGWALDIYESAHPAYGAIFSAAAPIRMTCRQRAATNWRNGVKSLPLSLPPRMTVMPPGKASRDLMAASTLVAFESL